MKKLLATLLLAAFAAATTFAVQITPASFAKKSEITIAGYSGATTLTNFPVLVKLAADSPIGFAYDDCEADGADIRFADADGNVIPHEIDSWDAAGTSAIWVSVPAISGTTTLFTMYYGAANASSLPDIDAQSVWTATDHRAVWHFSADETESAQGLAATKMGTPSYANDGAVGKCWQSAGTAWLKYDNAASWSALGEGSAVTISVWAKHEGAYNYNRILSTMSAWTKPAGYELTVQNQKNQITVGSSAQSQYQKVVSPGPMDEMVYLTAVYNADRYVDLYVNGVRQEHKLLNQVVQPTEPMTIAAVGNGGNTWNGKIDELRLHAVAESADWVKACYDTMASSTFVAIGDVEATGGAVPLTLRDNGYTQSGTQAVISGRLAQLGTGATSADVKVFYGTGATVDDTCASVDLGSFSSASDLTATLTGLTAGATYLYAFRAVNNAETPETAWTAPQSFVVEAATKLSGASAATENCKVTVSGAISEWGLGRTRFELLCGASANDLAVIQTTANMTTQPASGTVTFDPVTFTPGTYSYAVRAITTFEALVWTNATAVGGVTLSDTATYTWKGGAGNWTDIAMWTTTEEGAGGYPSDGCSAVFGDANSEVTLAANITLQGLTISSSGKHVFRSSAPLTARTITGPVTMDGAGGGTVVADSIVFANKISDLDGLKQFVIVSKGKAELGSSAATDITLVNGGWLYCGSVYNNDLSFGKLRVVGGPCIVSFSQYTQKGAQFASFEAVKGSGVPVVSITDGRISFADTTGIEMVGGAATIADGTSKIPVCVNFQSGNGKMHDDWSGKGMCTIDGGVIRVIPEESMMTTLAGATETDNVKIGAAFTLEEDVTVNALIFTGGKIDLGGHRVTVRSGVFREAEGGMYNNCISNGIIRLCRPNELGDGTPNSDARCKVEFETDGNTDPNETFIAFGWQSWGNWSRYSNYTNFTGTFAPPMGAEFQFANKMRSPGAVIEMRGGALLPGDHNIKSNFKGLAGLGSTNFSQKWNTLLWLGDLGADDQADFDAKKGAIVVGNGGFIKPGFIDYDGSRRGCLSVSYAPPQGTLPKLDTLEFRPGATFNVSVRADGTCSWLDATGSQSEGNYLNVALAGNLVLEEAQNVRTGTTWTIMRTGKPATGEFGIVTPSVCKIRYNVPIEDGTYAVQAELPAYGTVIMFR